MTKKKKNENEDVDLGYQRLRETKGEASKVKEKDKKDLGSLEAKARHKAFKEFLKNESKSRAEFLKNEEKRKIQKSKEDEALYCFVKYREGVVAKEQADAKKARNKQAEIEKAKEKELAKKAKEKEKRIDRLYKDSKDKKFPAACQKLSRLVTDSIIKHKRVEVIENETGLPSLRLFFQERSANKKYKSFSQTYQDAIELAQAIQRVLSSSYDEEKGAGQHILLQKHVNLLDAATTKFISYYRDSPAEGGPIAHKTELQVMENIRKELELPALHSERGEHKSGMGLGGT